jgi:hypothetical protein
MYISGCPFVYTPHQEDYFKDSFTSLQLCNSLVATVVHAKTFISIVNNVEADDVKNLSQMNYMNKSTRIDTYRKHSKLNAILKELQAQIVSHNCRCRCFVLNSRETTKIFKIRYRAA